MFEVSRTMIFGENSHLQRLGEVLLGIVQIVDDDFLPKSPFWDVKILGNRGILPCKLKDENVNGLLNSPIVHNKKSNGYAPWIHHFLLQWFPTINAAFTAMVLPVFLSVAWHMNMHYVFAYNIVQLLMHTYVHIITNTDYDLYIYVNHTCVHTYCIYSYWWNTWSR